EKKDSENQRLLQSNQQQVFLNKVLGGGGVVLIIMVGSLFYFFVGKQKANKQLEKQKRQIEINLREKESLLREIHHRVKNNLQVISSLLNMQSYHLDDPGMINAIAEGQSRVKAMALIHQKLYQTEQLTEIDFEEYTNQLINHLATAFGQPDKKINSKVSGANIKLDIDTAIPLGLILNELVTNAYKYAFEGVNEGDLAIELQRVDDHQYELTVADSGKGLPGDFDVTKLNSLGLKLVNMLIEQLDGQLTIQSENGTQFSIRFKETRMSA
ncbi:MAG: histidine kinase dimerization/phosphoacceptor domain -containing protein, partial [Cyclobacteriaceae bacterium]